MISVQEAFSIVDANTSLLGDTELRDLQKSVGYVLSENVLSPINMPPFDQSAMDGYALHLHDSLHYIVVGEVQAGSASNPKLKAGEAVRIFTGAAIPNDANAMIQQEKVKLGQGAIELQETVAIGINIRVCGEQIKQNDIALKKGTMISPAAVGFLAGLGVNKLKVYSKPKIAIIVTGDELKAAGDGLIRGQIYESNGIMLASALKTFGFADVTTLKVADDYINTINCIEKAIEQNELVLISGGISVGDYDYVGKALLELETKQLFYKVKQKPGKPLFFGKNKGATIFALPGNPAASLSCFYLYVLPTLRKMSGIKMYQLERIKAELTSDFKKVGDRAQFLKSQFANGKVDVLEGQSSAMLHTFSLANALAYIPEEVVLLKEGDIIEIIKLPEAYGI